EVSRIRRDRRLDAGGRTPSSSPGRRGIPLRLADLPSDDWPQVDAGLLVRLLDWAVSNARRRRTLLFEQQRRRLFLGAFVVRQAGRQVGASVCAVFQRTALRRSRAERVGPRKGLSP